jgi:CDP-diacylglycerol---glycerol-3-phosphate 3-phosphatidyltransferase
VSPGNVNDDIRAQDMKMTSAMIAGKYLWKSLLKAARASTRESKSALRDGGALEARVWKCFPLKEHHIKPFPSDPSQFHDILCHEIRNAKQRVLLASLYVGPAAHPEKSPREVELLNALKDIKSHVETKVLLDRNRGLRHVPTPQNTTVTSAEACRLALSEGRDDKSTEIYLHSVLSSFWQKVLPNPYNEACGVFHIKAYVIDNQLILSGANLSEEYFTDRHDRYIWLHNTELVDFYTTFLRILCQHSERYHSTHKHIDDDHRATSREEFLQSLLEEFTEEDSDQDKDMVLESDVIALAVPTFQAPPGYFLKTSEHKIPSDVRSIHGIIRSLSDDTSNAIVRVASAYLNPTHAMQKAWENVTVHMMTAGRVSHGFKPKETAGSKGKSWIPTVFDTVARQAIRNKCHLWFYQRDNWTFHAKGLWLSLAPSFESLTQPMMSSDEQLLAVTHGSGNFGWRSEYRDMESNLVLIFPRQSTLTEYHINEWNAMCKYVVPPSKKESLPLDTRFRYTLPFPFFRSFF